MSQTAIAHIPGTALDRAGCGSLDGVPAQLGLNHRLEYPGRARRQLRVLVVDNDPDMTDTMAAVVGLWGHRARRASNGPAALRAAGRFRPDVLLLDLAMPGMDGCEIARRLRVHVPALRRALLVAVTGFTDARYRRLAEQAGFDYFMTKPLDLSILEALLSSHRERLTEPAGDLGAASVLYKPFGRAEAARLVEAVMGPEATVGSQEARWQDDGGQGQ